MQQITLGETSAALRRILFVAELPADRNEIQRINLGDFGTGDTFTLTFNGQTTSAISYNASTSTVASSIDTALEALSNIDASAITVAYVSGASYDVTFGGNLAATDVPLLTITPTGFTPTGVTEVQHGGVALSPALHVTFSAGDILVSQNGATEATSQGSVTEIGSGRYYYEAHPEEVDTLGFLSLAITRDDISVVFPTAQIVAASSALGAPVIRSGTAQAGTSSSITLDADASELSNYYVPALVYLRSGNGAGQARLIHSYNGATKVASIEPNWVTPPNSATVFDVIPVEPSMADLTRANHATADTFGDVSTPEEIATEVLSTITDDNTPFSGADIASIESRIPAALSSGRMIVDAQAISGDTTTAARLKAHAAAVLQVIVGVGSTTSAVVLNSTTGINGAAPSSTNDQYNGRVLIFTSGTLAGQSQDIADYNGSTKTLTMALPFTGSASSGDTGVIV